MGKVLARMLEEIGRPEFKRRKRRLGSTAFKSAIADKPEIQLEFQEVIKQERAMDLVFSRVK